MMAVGCGQPRAHGQAMTSTATNRIMAGTNSPAMPHQMKKHHDRHCDDGRHKYGGNLIGQGLDGGFAALGFLDQSDDLRQDGIFAQSPQL